MTPSKWLQISLTVDLELAEPIAELLSRYATQGVAAHLEANHSITVSGWIKADSQLTQRRKAFEEGLWHLGQISELPEPEYREVEEDWIEVWKSKHVPIEIGQRLLIAPHWFEDQSPERVTVHIEPGIAFGSGAHPTTRLCLELLEGILRNGDRVLDLGCGSGILSIAAAKLGASSVVALDTDQRSIDSARENVSLNGVSGVVRAERGSLQEALQFAPFDLVLANIIAGILIDMLRDELPGTLAPGGQIVLSGILTDQSEEVHRVAESCGMQVLDIRSDDRRQWDAILLKQKSAAQHAADR